MQNTQDGGDLHFGAGDVGAAIAIVDELLQELTDWTTVKFDAAAIASRPTSPLSSWTSSTPIRSAHKPITAIWTLSDRWKPLFSTQTPPSRR